jgi:hypothetical protein
MLSTGSILGCGNPNDDSTSISPYVTEVYWNVIGAE